MIDESSAAVEVRADVPRRGHLPSDSRCDVLHVVWPGAYSGVVLQVAGFVRAGARAGGMVHRVCFLGGIGPVGDALEAEGLAYRLYFRRGWGPIGLWRFARSLRMARPQLVHFHWRVFGAIGVASVVLPRTPFVWTEHHPGPVVTGARTRYFYRLLRRRFSRVVVTSEAMVGYVERYRVARRKVEIIPYALLIRRRPPGPVGGANGAVIGVVTRLDDRKRLDLFLDVLAELRHRGLGCSGLIVGDGPHRAQYETYARKLALDEAVEFVGMKADVAEWLDRFDVFLTTSAVDTFGIASLEAMARSVPVVAMPCPGGLAELVERGGVLVRDRNPQTAADAVESLLASPGEHLRVASRGYEVAAEHTVEAALEGHLKMYRELGVDSMRAEGPVEAK
jgi:glycosyltransferase involved in cell wall biosynthesis